MTEILKSKQCLALEGAPARHREPYSMLFVLLLARSGEAGGSLCLYYKW